MGPPSPSRPQGARGATAAAAYPLGSVSWAAPGSAAAAAEQREPGAGRRAPPRVGQGRARAFAASWAPSSGHRGHQPQEPPGLLAAEPERPPGSPASPSSALFSSLLSLLLPLQLSVMATEPPSPLRLEAPGPPEMRTPPAGETAREGTPKPAGGRLRFLNGCVPLSHQVAGHMYGKDKVGKWGWRGARRTPSALREPRAGRGSLGPAGRAGRPSGCVRRTPSLFRFPPEPRDPCSRGSKSGTISGVWGVRRAAGGGGERSVWSPQGGWVLIEDGFRC